MDLVQTNVCETMLKLKKQLNKHTSQCLNIIINSHINICKPEALCETFLLLCNFNWKLLN